MIVDGHIHLSNVPTAGWGHPPFTAEDVLQLMDGPFSILGQSRRVERAVIQPHLVETMAGGAGAREQHAYITASVKKYPDRLTGCFTINPHMGVEAALSDLKDLVRDGGYRMIKLHPNFHGYMPPRSRAMLDPIFETAGKLRVPVLIHTGDPPFAVPILLAPLVEAHPDTRVIIAHLGAQWVSYAPEAIYMGRKYENVLVETGWAPLPRLKEAAQTLGARKLVFGSDCPILEIGGQLRTIEVLTWKPPMGLGLSEGDVEQIMGGNMAELLRDAAPAR